jgi:hypothetical protein
MEPPAARNPDSIVPLPTPPIERARRPTPRPCPPASARAAVHHSGSREVAVKVRRATPSRSPLSSPPRNPPSPRQPQRSTAAPNPTNVAVCQRTEQYESDTRSIRHDRRCSPPGEDLRELATAPTPPVLVAGAFRSAPGAGPRPFAVLPRHLVSPTPEHVKRHDLCAAGRDHYLRTLRSGLAFLLPFCHRTAQFSQDRTTAA